MKVLITGASRGIGAEMMTQMRDRGDDVTGTSRSGGDIDLDVSDLHSVQHMARAFGEAPLDLLVCNAGIFPDRGMDLDTEFPADMWAEVFATNVTGAFLTIQALLPNLRKAKGKIAIISSQMGSSTKASGGSYIYRSSKAAVANLAFNLASDLRADGVAVGAYHPGWVQTDMGGDSAAVTPHDSAAGLIKRFDMLTIANTGLFETYSGEAHPV